MQAEIPETQAEIQAARNSARIRSGIGEVASNDLRSVAPDIDPEFLEVFLEEAREELATIAEQQALWRENLADRQAMTTIRRAFHTLKGSGRVVGATVIGDFAWVSKIC
jgi:chemosensory pili system protein ChpA (sensor histidine kinase/response regulator)